MLQPQWKKFKVMSSALLIWLRKKHAPGRAGNLLCCRTALEFKFVSDSLPGGIYMPVATISYFYSFFLGGGGEGREVLSPFKRRILEKQ